MNHTRGKLNGEKTEAILNALSKEENRNILALLEIETRCRKLCQLLGIKEAACKAKLEPLVKLGLIQRKTRGNKYIFSLDKSQLHRVLSSIQEDNPEIQEFLNSLLGLSIPAKS